MGNIILNDGYSLSDFGKPYIVAEMNTSHFGKLETAKTMIDEAKEAGCNCVKFQSWTTDSLYSKTYYEQNPIAKRFVKGFSFSEEQLEELALYCKKIGISFSSTPYSNSEVDFLVDKCKVPFVKVASMDLNNHIFLDYIGKKGVPIILSTGMGDMQEIREAIKVLEKTGNKNICILHCISIYPPEISTIRLNNILGLREEFPNYPIGFSDHSIGIEIPVASIALGACLIEKHFTLDKSKIGMDNQVATEPDEMKTLVQSCNNVQLALGSKERIVLEEELKKRKEMRRSVVANKDLKAGDIIKLEDLDVKRPGTGIAADKIFELVGKKLGKDVDKDSVIFEWDCE
ncbi:N-acetylneuraminate synthase family protein [Aliarcobacter cryaerophilus]|uniref:N-acetylneuraminate synthase family protein n=1 Tax=Aliarcobacter cryaerophilus TaxID=28198 RepID=UPI003BAE417A